LAAVVGVLVVLVLLVAKFSLHQKWRSTTTPTSEREDQDGVVATRTTTRVPEREIETGSLGGASTPDKVLYLEIIISRNLFKLHFLSNLVPNWDTNNLDPKKHETNLGHSR
jgi:hypothetical protein